MDNLSGLCHRAFACHKTVYQACVKERSLLWDSLSGLCCRAFACHKTVYQARVIELPLVIVFLYSFHLPPSVCPSFVCCFSFFILLSSCWSSSEQFLAFAEAVPLSSPSVCLSFHVVLSVFLSVLLLSSVICSASFCLPTGDEAPPPFTVLFFIIRPFYLSIVSVSYIFVSCLLFICLFFIIFCSVIFIVLLFEQFLLHAKAVSYVFIFSVFCLSVCSSSFCSVLHHSVLLLLLFFFFQAVSLAC